MKTLKKGTVEHTKMTTMLEDGKILPVVSNALRVDYLEMIQVLANERVEDLVRNKSLKSCAGHGTCNGSKCPTTEGYNHVSEASAKAAATEINRLTAEALLLNYQNCVEASLELIVEEFPILVDKDFKDLVNIREYSYSDKFEVEVGGIVIITMKEGGTPEFTEDWREKVSSAIKAKILSEMMRVGDQLLDELGINKEGDVK